MEKVMKFEEVLLEKFRTLPIDQQQQVLDFMEYLQSKLPQVKFKHPDGSPMSALEAAKDFAGCLDAGPGDLATNKKYLEKLRTE